MDTYKKQLIECGLSENQASIYELLIRSGALRASSIVRKLESKLSRPMVYAVLDELVKMGMVEKDEQSAKVTRFVPAHPSKLQDIAAERRKVADAVADAASLLIPRIVSDYNLILNKPGVRFFEGRDGVRLVLNDTLTSQTPILSYTDVEQIEKHYKQIGDEYVKKREERGLVKKLLLDDTSFVRSFYAGSEETHSEVRLIPKSEHPYQVAIQIYDDKVSYLTLNPDKEMAVIIQDHEIAALQRHLFEELYNRAQQLYAPEASPLPPTFA